MTAKKRVRAPDDPHRSEPRVKRKRPGTEVMLSPETKARLRAHAEREGVPLSRLIERFSLEGLAREREP